jgi:hypothetical protein
MRYKQGIYNITNISKYIQSSTAKSNTAIYRSSWERIAFMYLDNNNSIKRWGSECVVIPYRFRLDKKDKLRKYYIDLIFEDSYGVHLVEIKPKFKTDINKIKNMKNERFLIEYVKNIDKWKYANEYAKQNNMKFTIWTEDHITELKRRLSVYKI